MSVHRLLLVALFVDAGAIWAVALILVALLRDRARQRPPNAPALEPWPITPSEDPWQPEPGTPSWDLLLVTDTAPPPLPPAPVPGSPWWNRPTSALPRLEGRRTIRPRNDPPAAAQPRYIELLLTRRAG